MNHPLLAIVGPTASGKTELGLRLAAEQNGEIISVDSRQVYQRLSIGTAKPIGQWQTRHKPIDKGDSKESASHPHSGMGRLYIVEGIPYHLVDFLDPSLAFSAADFVRRASHLVQDIQARGKTPIFVGGTGLYFKALSEGLADLPPARPEIRARLKAEAQREGRAVLHARLAQVDPVAAAQIPANNIQRLVRALEVFEATGKPISRWHLEHKRQTKEGMPLTFKGIAVSREELHRRIEARCRKMISQGMVEETREILRQGYPDDCPALTGLGYPRILAHLKGTISQTECLQLLLQDTRQYAKRQMTWFRHQLSVTWEKA